LLSSAAQILDKTWTTTSKKNLVTLFLCGSKRLTDEQNKNIFCIVQNYIKNTKRFSPDSQ